MTRKAIRAFSVVVFSAMFVAGPAAAQNSKPTQKNPAELLDTITKEVRPKGESP